MPKPKKKPSRKAARVRAWHSNMEYVRLREGRRYFLRWRNGDWQQTTKGSHDQCIGDYKPLRAKEARRLLTEARRALGIPAAGKGRVKRA